MYSGQGVTRKFMDSAHREIEHCRHSNRSQLHEELERHARNGESKSYLVSWISGQREDHYHDPREYRDLQEQASRSAMERARNSSYLHGDKYNKYFIDPELLKTPYPFKIPSGGPKVNKKLLLV